MSETSVIYSLTEVTHKYLLRKFNDREKYFARYFSIAGDVYKEIYRNILPTIISKYVEVFTDPTNEPYPFIYKPTDMQRFFGVWVSDRHNRLVQVFYNNDINIYPKPPIKKVCGCNSTELCDCIDNFQTIVTPIVIDGTTYYKRQWLKCCPNGDVLEYCEIPVKDFVGGQGDYNDDYNDDFDIINDGSNVQVLKLTRNLGRLELMPCGCPKENPYNKEVVFGRCGCFLPLKPACCRTYYRDELHCEGELKFSACGTKIYLRNVITDKGFVIISYQQDPTFCGEEIFVYDYAQRALWAGIEEESTIWFPKATLGEKQFAKNSKRKENADLFSYLNPINRSRLFNAVTAEIRL